MQNQNLVEEKLKQIMRHLEFLNEEIIQMENEIFLLEDDYDKLVCDIAKGEINCFKGILSIIMYLMKKISLNINVFSKAKKKENENKKELLKKLDYSIKSENNDLTKKIFGSKFGTPKNNQKINSEKKLKKISDFSKREITARFLNNIEKNFKKKSNESSKKKSDVSTKKDENENKKKTDSKKITENPKKAKIPENPKTSENPNPRKNKKIEKRKKRGTYRKYTILQRKEAISLAQKLDDINTTALILDVPIKNLKRWLKNGFERKKGGRKTQDPEMEVKLKAWICEFFKFNKKMPEHLLIKKMALKLSNFQMTFKASKGWYEKFILRHFAGFSKKKGGKKGGFWRGENLREKGGFLGGENLRGK